MKNQNIQVSRPFSSYHNTLIKWIKDQMLIKFEIVEEFHPNVYDSKTKMWKLPKAKIKVLRLYFINEKSYFVREQYIDDYLKIIKEHHNI